MSLYKGIHSLEDLKFTLDICRKELPGNAHPAHYDRIDEIKRILDRVVSPPLEWDVKNMVHEDFLTIKGFSDLTPEQADLFAHTYKRHYHGHGTEARKKRTPDQIKEIKWDATEECLKVYYRDEWYHYDTEGWY